MRFLAAFALCAALAAQIPTKDFFKTAGSPTAPITFELYTDFQCPHCREFYLDTLPLLVKDYVNTGKVRLVHRDYVLGSFPFSQAAARYANASGEIGKYEVVARQIFETQPEWSQNGNIDAAVAKVLSASEMQQVRNLVRNDSTLDDLIRTDMEKGAKDGLNQTPTLVVVSKGRREVISGAVPFPVLKSYLDQKLGK